MGTDYLPKIELSTLPRVLDRMTFLYVDYSKVNSKDSAVVVSEKRGSAYIPAASISTWLLGPGTSITHRAVQLIGECGASILWVGEMGVRLYAQGAPLTHSSSLLVKQAALVSNVRSRLSVARKMYQLRFPDEDVSKLTMQQLRGKEGARVRAAYRKFARKTGVTWNGRVYKPGNFGSSDSINKTLTSANACLYGVVYSIICALGCSTGLGFIHTGHELSFVYDIADLYKAQTSIPISFKLVSEGILDPEKEVRKQMRDVFFREHFLEKCVRDIRYLLLAENEEGESYADLVQLWDEGGNEVASGVSYSSYDEENLNEKEDDYLW